MIKSGKHCGKRIKLLVLSNFFFCHYVFKTPSAAEASESVCMRERVKSFSHTVHLAHLQQTAFENIVEK